MKTTSRMLIQIIVFCLAFQSPAAWSAPSPNCRVLVSEFKEGSQLSSSAFRNTEYRIVGVKSGDEVRSPGYLQSNEVALGFDLDGTIKIYFNGMEALLDRNSDLSFEVIPVDHELDLTRHDMIFVYRHLAGTKVEKAIKSLFDLNRSERQVITGYNQVAAVCNIMRADRCAETEPLQYHLDKLIRELVVLGQSAPNYRPTVFVSKEAKSPEQFLKTLSGLDVSDKARVANRNENIFLMSAIGIMSSFLVFMIYLLFFMPYY